MESLVRFATGAVAVYLALVGLQPDNPTPSPVPAPGPPPVTISSQEIAFPSPPTNASLLTASAKVKDALLAQGTSDIAWKLACSFKDFAEVLGRNNSDFKTTQDFQDAYFGTNLALYKKYPGMTNFQGSLNAAFDGTITAAFALHGLAENNQVKAAAWNADSQAAASDAFRAISYQSYMAYQELVKNRK